MPLTRSQQHAASSSTTNRGVARPTQPSSSRSQVAFERSSSPQVGNNPQGTRPSLLRNDSASNRTTRNRVGHRSRSNRRKRPASEIILTSDDDSDFVEPASTNPGGNNHQVGFRTTTNTNIRQAQRPHFTRAAARERAHASYTPATSRRRVEVINLVTPHRSPPPSSVSISSPSNTNSNPSPPQNNNHTEDDEDRIRRQAPTTPSTPSEQNQRLMFYCRFIGPNASSRLRLVTTLDLKILDRVLMSNFRTKYVVLEPGQISTCIIDEEPSCTCVTFCDTRARVNRSVLDSPCVHLIFIYIQILKVSTSNPVWWHFRILRSDLETITQNAPRLADTGFLATREVRAHYHALLGTENLINQHDTSDNMNQSPVAVGYGLVPDTNTEDNDSIRPQLTDHSSGEEGSTNNNRGTNNSNEQITNVQNDEIHDVGHTPVVGMRGNQSGDGGNRNIQHSISPNIQTNDDTIQRAHANYHQQGDSSPTNIVTAIDDEDDCPPHTHNTSDVNRNRYTDQDTRRLSILRRGFELLHTLQVALRYNRRDMMTSNLNDARSLESRLQQLWIVERDRQLISMGVRLRLTINRIDHYLAGRQTAATGFVEPGGRIHPIRTPTTGIRQTAGASSTMQQGNTTSHGLLSVSDQLGFLVHTCNRARNAHEARVNEIEARVNEIEAQANENEAQVNENEAQVNENEAHANENEAHTNENEAQVNVNEAQVNVNEAQVNVNEAHTNENEAHTNENEAQVNVNEAHANENGQNKENNNENEKTDCMICFEELPQASSSQSNIIFKCPECRQTFHKHCVDQWFQNSLRNTCPHCRSPVGRFRPNNRILPRFRRTQYPVRLTNRQPRIPSGLPRHPQSWMDFNLDPSHHPHPPSFHH